MKKLIAIATITLILLATAPVLWIYFNYFHTKPLTQQEQTLLTPDWSKVTHNNWSPWITLTDDPTVTKQWNPTASYNNYLSTIPDEDKAWPILVDVDYAHKDMLESEGPGSSPLQPTNWATMVQYLNQPETQSAIERILTAFNKPHLGCYLHSSTDEHTHAAMLKHGFQDDDWNPNPDQNPDLLNIRLPSFGAHRRTAYLINSSAMYQLELGNPDAFVQQISAALRSIDLQNEFPTLLTQLVQSALASKAYDTIFWALEYHAKHLTDTHLKQLSDLIGDKSDDRYTWEAEALMGHDALRRLADENGQLSYQKMSMFSSPGVLPTSVPDTKLSVPFQRSLWVHNSILKPLENISGLWPTDTSLAATNPDKFIEQQLKTLDVRLATPLEIFIPAIGKAASRHRMLIQTSLALQLTIAAHRHKLRQGTFPNSIEAIDNDLLTVDPVDIISKQPLRYIVKDSKPIIYSVGDDRIDNQGQPRWYYDDISEYGQPEQLIRKYQIPELMSPEEAKAMLNEDPNSITGDWVFFPIPQDEPEPLPTPEEDLP